EIASQPGAVVCTIQLIEPPSARSPLLQLFGFSRHSSKPCPVNSSPSPLPSAGSLSPPHAVTMSAAKATAATLPSLLLEIITPPVGPFGGQPEMARLCGSDGSTLGVGDTAIRRERPPISLLSSP